MQLEINLIINQLSEIIELKPGYEIQAVESIEPDSTHIFKGWMVVRSTKDGYIPAFVRPVKTLKELVSEIHLTELDRDPNKFYPFDVVEYIPTKEIGIVKRVTDNGAFVLFRMQSTPALCALKDLERSI